MEENKQQEQQAQPMEEEAVVEEEQPAKEGETGRIGRQPQQHESDGGVTQREQKIPTTPKTKPPPSPFTSPDRDDDDRYVDQAYEERVQAQEKALTKAWPMFVATEGWARVNNPSKSQAKKIFQEYKEQKPDWQVLVRNLAEGQVRNGFTPRRADSRLRQVRAEADDVLNRRAQQERETQQQSLSLNT